MSILSDYLAHIYPEIFGKSIYAMAEESTGVSNKIWRKGGPKREKKINDAREHALVWAREHLTTNGKFSLEEANERIRYLTHSEGKSFGTLTLFIKSFNTLNRYCWTETELLAQSFDDIDLELVNLYKEEKWEAYRDKIVPLLEEEDVRTWFTETDDKAFLDVLESAKKSSDRDVLGKITAYWTIQAIFRTLACWDVEFQAKYLSDSVNQRGMSPQPLLSLLLPKLNPKNTKKSDGSISPRGIFLLPLRQFLELSYCFAHHQRYKKWPMQRNISRKNIAAWIGNEFEQDTEKLLAKIYRGTRAVTANNFSDMWYSMTKLEGDEIVPMPPWPLYIAAQIWTHLFTKSQQIKGTKMVVSLALIDPAVYKYWWDKALNNFKDKSVFFGEIPWPKYLIS